MPEENNLVAMTIEVVANYVAHNNLRPEDVPDFIAKTHAAISGISKEGDGPVEDAAASEAEFTPAVTVRKSLASPDHILSLIDGKPYKSLKRHLGSHGLTPAEYRVRYGLKADYPMVAPGYSERRREVAKRLGLGRKPQVQEAPADTQAPAPAPEAAVPAPTTAKPAPKSKAKSNPKPAAQKSPTGKASAKTPKAKPASAPKQSPAKQPTPNQPAAEQPSPEPTVAEQAAPAQPAAAEKAAAKPARRRTARPAEASAGEA